MTMACMGLAALILLALGSLAGPATDGRSIGPVRLSIAELRASWRGVSEALREINGPEAATRTLESLTARFDGTETALVVDGRWVAPEGLSGSSGSLFYRFEADGAPVSHVWWNLSHSTRVLMATGATAESTRRGLDAWTSRLASYERRFGGDHAFGPIFLLLEGVLLVAALGALALGRRRPGIVLLVVLFAAPIPVAFLELAWVDRLLPGFRVTAP